MTLSEIYACGQHNYTPGELAANLRAYGLKVFGDELSSVVDGPEELMAEARAQIKRNLFLADWDGPSATGTPNTHREGCPCPRCANRGGIPRTAPRVAARVWPEEKELIQAAADRAGMSVDAWARKTLLANC